MHTFHLVTNIITSVCASFPAHTLQLVISYHMNANIMCSLPAAHSHVQAAYTHAHNSSADIHLFVPHSLQLVISYHMNANIMCEYSREEWVNGLSRMSCDSIDKLRAKLPELRGELRDPARFQEVYSFAFSWAREVRWVKRCSWSCRVMGGAEPLGAWGLVYKLLGAVFGSLEAPELLKVQQAYSCGESCATQRASRRCTAGRARWAVHWAILGPNFCTTAAAGLILRGRALPLGADIAAAFRLLMLWLLWWFTACVLLACSCCHLHIVY
jgi:hypothetical protein